MYFISLLEYIEEVMCVRVALVSQVTFWSGPSESESGSAACVGWPACL